MVEQLCSRVVILSGGHIVAEQDMASFAATRSGSLEEVFVRVTRQEDFTPIARQILATVAQR
jgi:ABC-type Na+ transport system ATPase subunit NatA